MLIDLNLIESPWAYSVMVVTILIDAYLLYFFFAVQRPASNAIAGIADAADTRRPAA